ncbi:Peptidase family U32 [Actinopolymorpha cephalotaxi]|uniref:Peptidase family U32 n=1 Tax=Actinopolymorpha cephalotaxi TaxID=504797 RepID=A0A1I2KG46_9ACTN|nr:U32 family peptidase [Actinopolymorpha cephalotaxi]SFF65992.1 Peptidase family U32 [Actinopolymorpha cephalotaxi]
MSFEIPDNPFFKGDLVGGTPASHLLDILELPRGDLNDLPASAKRFPDGMRYRVEIPSTEGPRCLEAALEEADRLEVPVRRISQGSGVFLLTDAELDEMAEQARSAGVEVSLFARPCAGWGTSATARSQAGGGFAATAHGQDQVSAVLEDVVRAAEHGIRSVLISDLGVLAAFGKLRAGGHLPADMQAKVSVMLPVTNAATARVLEDLGADTLNLATDLSLAQIAAIRAVVDVPLDVYVEAPDNLGGYVRHHELPRLIEVAAPVYVKFGLRNAPDVYPAGTHLEATTVALTRERVRRARLGMDLLVRHGAAEATSERNAAGLAVPVKAANA